MPLSCPDGSPLTGEALIAGARLVELGSWSGKQWIPRAATEFDGWIASAAKTSFTTLADGIRAIGTREARGPS